MKIIIQSLSQITLLLAATLLMASGCSSIRTHNDYDPKTNFANFETFAWAGGHEHVLSREIGDRIISPLDLRRIEQAIETELARSGYRQVDDPVQADFLVSYTVGAREKIEIDRYPEVYRDRWIRHWPYQLSSVEVHSYTEGTLAIDIYDRANHRPAWHGVARKRVTGSDIEDSGPIIREVVGRILSEFPPE